MNQVMNQWILVKGPSKTTQNPEKLIEEALERIVKAPAQNVTNAAERGIMPGTAGSNKEQGANNSGI